MLTAEEDREMKENLARKNFGMSLDEFTEAWKAGKFDATMRSTETSFSWRRCYRSIGKSDRGRTFVSSRRAIVV